MKKITALFKLIVVLAMGFFLVLYLSSALRPKKTEQPNDTSTKVSGFYALEDHSLDVLFLGTSHTYYAFNPAVLYQQTGLSSYVFAGECQPMPVTYHYLKEALKTQSPQLIVLDVFSLLPSSSGCQTSGIYKKNLEDLKFSQNKIDALKLIPEEDLLENLFDIAIYKDRWTELTRFDLTYPLKDHFNPYFGYTNGYPVDGPIYEREVYTFDEVKVIEDDNLVYLKMIFDLADEHGIKVMLVKTPYYETREEYMMTNYLFSLAHERGYSTLNLNQYVHQMDFLFDRDGDLWHCNVRGAWKSSLLVSQLIREQMPVKMTESIYDQQYKDLHETTMLYLLKTQYNVYDYLKMLREMDVTLLVNYKGNAQSRLTPGEWELIQALGIEKFNLNNDYLAVVEDRNTIYSCSQMESFTCQLESLQEVSCAVDDHWVKYFYQNQEYSFNYNGINLTIIDRFSGRVVDQLCLDTMGYFQILK